MFAAFSFLASMLTTVGLLLRVHLRCLNQSLALFMDVVIHPELPGARLEVPTGFQGMIQCKVMLSHT